MTTFDQIEKFDVGFDFIKGQPVPDETETIVAFHTLDTTPRLGRYAHRCRKLPPCYNWSRNPAHRASSISHGPNRSSKSWYHLERTKDGGIVEYVIP